MNNNEQYLQALNLIISMRKCGVISDSEFKKSESFLAKKYCIKKGSLLRPNDLINNSFRAMYMTNRKEVKNNASKENRS